MFIGCRALIDLCWSLDGATHWVAPPSEAAIAASWGRARELVGKLSDPVEEAAALFYVLSADFLSLRDAAFQLPIVATAYQLDLNGIAPPDADCRRLTDELQHLQNEIVDGMEFEDVRLWFTQRIKRK